MPREGLTNELIYLLLASDVNYGPLESEVMAFENCLMIKHKNG